MPELNPSDCVLTMVRTLGASLMGLRFETACNREFFLAQDRYFFLGRGDGYFTHAWSGGVGDTSR